MNAKAEDHSEITVGFHAVKYRAPNHAATPILSDITLEIRRGETVALLGRMRERKKTTLLKLVNRLLKPTAGEILVNGQAIDVVDPIRLRRGIGYVIQEGGLFPHYTVAENIGLCRGWRGGHRAELGHGRGNDAAGGVGAGRIRRAETARAFRRTEATGGRGAGLGCGSRDLVDG